METVREQAARHRAARGLTDDQRHFVAVTLWQWWTVGGPHRQVVVMGASDKLRAMGDEIDEGSRRYPELIRTTANDVRARIERFREERHRPVLSLSPGGPIFRIREYNNWGMFRGFKIDHHSPSSRWHMSQWIPWLTRRMRWDSSDITIARNTIRSAESDPSIKVPSWIVEAVRSWNRIEKAKGLIPTPSERQRYRKAAGLVRPRKTRSSCTH